jgi:DNA mismatch repair protein MutS
MNTPLMRQYSGMKAKYPDTILLFRLGDFYETFEEDARITSKVLGITLTRRNNGAAGEIPLAGFPYHALESYLPKLLKAGYRVAVCEQMEDPKLAKGLVKRDVIEVVTPGVAFSDKVLDQNRNNYLACIALPHALATADDIIGLAVVDVTTAEFSVSEFPFRQLPEQIASLAPAEILVQSRDKESLPGILKSQFGGLWSKLDDWIFNHEYAYELLTGHFKTHTLKGFGLEEMRLGTIAAGAVMNYLQETQKANLTHLRRIVPLNIGEHMILDPSTKRNLEITRSVEGREEGTLVWVLDHTRTPMGGRLLRKWISQPLRSLEPIQTRQESVAEIIATAGLRHSLTATLSRIGDLERLMARICTNRANPREVASLRPMLLATADLIGDLATAVSPAVRNLGASLKPLPGLADAIEKTLTADPPLSLADGGVIRPGCSPDLDSLRDIAVNGKSWIATLQKTERENTGISSLKVGFNNVFGYYIEVTNTHREKVPMHYVRKQTLANAERYIIPELKEYEDKILNAEEKILSLETELFNSLRSSIAAEAPAIQENAQLIAKLDCFVSLAESAIANNYVRPEVNTGSKIEIHEGRHPVIEKLLPPGEAYTPNDALLDNDSNQILIITGPNMSGKSSYLRQAGLIVLLAQIGSFVPAKSAVIGIVDRIYTRVGASDNIASGESTFLVEMHEAANIVNTATPKSLILLDEVGRGTSTFDGISIAWALTEYLHNRIGAKTLFATHYHELNELADLFPRISNLKVEVREYGDKVIFLHKVVPGFADHSYGIQVAQMAGLPDEITTRAHGILKNLEGSELTVHGEGGQQNTPVKGRIAPAEVQLTLFEMKDDKLRQALKSLDIDKLTPLEALQKLSELKKQL